MNRKKATANGHTNGHGRIKHDKHEVSVRLQALRADMDALQDDVRGLAGDAALAAQEQVHGVLNGAATSAQQVVSRFEDWGNENLQGVKDAVREKPLKAFMLSMGAGALLGAFFLRR